MEKLNQHDFERGIYDALKDVVEIWATDQKDALDIAQNKVPHFKQHQRDFPGRCLGKPGNGRRDEVVSRP